MNFKQLSALRTLKGRLVFRLKKCLFSDTSTSAPTHSAYAAIKASASFNPIRSYFRPNSNGTTKSSSIVVRRFINLIKIWKSLGDKLVLTSSTKVLQIARECNDLLALIRVSKASLSFCLNSPREKIYSLASRTRCKLLLPENVSGFAHMLNDFFFAHACKGRWLFGYALAQFFKKFCCLVWAGFFGGSVFHIISPRLATGKSRDFSFPKFLSCFPQLIYNIFLAHLENRGRVFCNYLSEFFKMFPGFFGIGFNHY